MENTSNDNVGSKSMGKLDQVATWVSSTVVSAFFASLERCSCVNLTTNDPDDDDDEEANDRPLALSSAAHPTDVA